MSRRAFASRLAASVGLTLGVACSTPALEPLPPPAALVEDHGTDGGRGNLLALQAWMQPADYESEEALFARLDELFEEAAARGWLGPRTVAVLPEYIGAWLVAEGESDDTFRAATTTDAMGNVVLAHPAEWMGALLSSPAEDGATYATFHAKAARMAEVYQRVMARLARERQVTLVAGSILLPAPSVVDGAIALTEGGALQNASFVFAADGTLLSPAVIKSFPTADEQAFLAAGDPAALPVFDTPAGRLGVLVCADAWFPATWRALDEGGADLIAVPVFVAGDGVWEEPWRGYSGHAEPADVDDADIGALTEGEAWRKYTVPGRLPTTRARAGITAPLRGTLWDMASDGRALLAKPDGSTAEGPRYDGPALVNLWL